MGKAVMISIRPEWVAKIATGQKTIEVRKDKPTNIYAPFKCYIYCTGGKPLYMAESRYCKERKRILKFSEDGKSLPFSNGTAINGTVIGEFTCHNIKWIPGTELDYPENLITETEESFLTVEQMRQYSGWKENLPPWEKKDLYGWEISDLKIYGKPKELSDFKQCHRCEYYKFCNESELSCDRTYNLRRPPQSWCYVEELPE